MRPEVQRSAIERLLRMTRDLGSEVPSRSTKLSIDRYVDPTEYERERGALFHGRPVIVAHVSEIAEAGDFVTEELAGIPLVVLRDSHGDVQVFVNACRHRGARLIDDPSGTCNKAITCPYHAWSYRLDGSLLHIPNEDVFGAIDHHEFGLKKVPHQVHHGFVWVLLDPPDGETLDMRAALGSTLDDDFDAFGLASHSVARTVTTTRHANWKLVMDAFAEGYHVRSLHRKSLSRFFVNGQILDDCAPHVRQVGARKSLLEAVQRDPEAWDFRRDTTAFYTLFPNAVLVFHPLWLSQMSLMPEGADGVRVVHRMLVANPPTDSEERERLERSFTHIQEQVFEKEDLAIVESIQSTFDSGANSTVLVGGLEEGMRLFHAARDRALAAADR
ncbi:MAG: aromatic ring-hydroxylating dioxygenase subunit alpha [Myxococcota bacterium]